MDQSFKKIEKLKSQKLIEKLFSEGKSVAVYPLRLVYLKTSFDDAVQIKTGVSVSKRNFKTAVARNRIKRLMREAYRLNKAKYFDNIPDQYAFMILYIGKTGTDFQTISKKMNTLMDVFLKHQSLPKP
ncbi:MAG: ribonuclease P protein component [Gelidibacter sp.]